LPIGKSGVEAMSAKSDPAESTAPLKVVGYARVSTAEQVEEGVSLDAQAERLRLYCTLHRLDLVTIHTDAGVSAKSLDRPALQLALADLSARRARGLVIAKLDRLSRSVADWQALIEGYFGPAAGHQLLSVGDSIDTRTASGRLGLNLLMSVAQWEREANAERTREALAHKRRQGQRTGTIPYGFRLGPDDRLEPDPAETVVLSQIAELRRDGLSIRRIAQALEAAGVRPRQGRSWSLGTLSRLAARIPKEDSTPCPDPDLPTATPPCSAAPSSEPSSPGASEPPSWPAPAA